jgi:hypothetical protein
MSILATFITGFVLGAICYDLFIQIRNKVKYLKIRTEIKSFFEEIRRLLKTKDSDFSNRINHLVFLKIKNSTKGNIDLIYDITKNEILISKEGKIINSCNDIDEKLKIDIIQDIQNLFWENINDIVDIGGHIMDRKTFEETLSAATKKVNLIINQGKNPSLDVVSKEEENLSLDSILDKISESGIDSLNESEKTFLKKYSK